LKLANYTRIENAHKVRKKLFVFYFVVGVCTFTQGKEQIRACVSRSDQSAWTVKARNDAHMASTGVWLYLPMLWTPRGKDPHTFWGC